MNFSSALDLIKWGAPMTREVWADPRVYVYRLNPPDTDKINIHTGLGNDHLWQPSLEDLFANDWKQTVRAD